MCSMGEIFLSRKREGGVYLIYIFSTPNGIEDLLLKDANKASNFIYSTRGKFLLHFSLFWRFRLCSHVNICCNDDEKCVSAQQRSTLEAVHEMSNCQEGKAAAKRDCYIKELFQQQRKKQEKCAFAGNIDFGVCAGGIFIIKFINSPAEKGNQIPPLTVYRIPL